MQNTFHISHTPELVLGCGEISKLYEMLLPFTGPGLVVTGGSAWKAMSFFHGFIEKLKSEGQFAGHIKITHEPSPKDIDDAVFQSRQKGIGCVISIGGGSVIDAGKAISAMLRSKGSIVDYLEGVGTKLPTGLKVPFIAVPTTAGTGSEATLNAVITREGDNGFKKSLRHVNYVPGYRAVGSRTDGQLSARDYRCQRHGCFYPVGGVVSLNPRKPLYGCAGP